MKNGSNNCKAAVDCSCCNMCGSTSEDYWQTEPDRIAHLILYPRLGDEPNLWCVCDECLDGVISAFGMPRIIQLN
jgi:hypothetical protein